jgi:hypothetical protein
MPLTQAEITRQAEMNRLFAEQDTRRIRNSMRVSISELLNNWGNKRDATPETKRAMELFGAQKLAIQFDENDGDSANESSDSICYYQPPSKDNPLPTIVFYDKKMPFGFFDDPIKSCVQTFKVSITEPWLRDFLTCFANNQALIESAARTAEPVPTKPFALAHTALPLFTTWRARPGLE